MTLYISPEVEFDVGLDSWDFSVSVDGAILILSKKLLQGLVVLETSTFILTSGC